MTSAAATDGFETAGSTVAATGTTGAAPQERETRPYPRPCPGLSVDAGQYDKLVANACESSTTSGHSRLPLHLVLVLDRTVAMAQILAPGEGPSWNEVGWGLARFFETYAERLAGQLAVSVVLLGATDWGMDRSICEPGGAVGHLDSTSLAEDVEAFFDRVGHNQESRTMLPAMQTAAELVLGTLVGQESTVSDSEVLLIAAGPPDECDGEGSIEDVAQVAAALFDPSASVRASTSVIELGTGFDLNPIAQAGGTPAAFVVPGPDVAGAIESILFHIVFEPNGLNCSYSLPSLAGDNTLCSPMYDEVSLTVTGPPPASVPELESASQCEASPNGGWWRAEASNLSGPIDINVCPCTCAWLAAETVDALASCRPVPCLQ